MRIQLKGPGHATSLLAELNRCRRTRQYCDVFLQVGSRTFAAHRAVLACTGTYFNSLLGQPAASSSAVLSLEFISPANLEKVLTFVYTGEILIDLIDVGVLYELAERLGISELVQACHATFPDLRASVSVKGGGGELPPPPSTVPASSLCSSSASCSSLSSPPGSQDASLPLEVKTEEVHVSCGPMAAGLQPELALPSGPGLQVKPEKELQGGGCESCRIHRQMTPDGFNGPAAPAGPEPGGVSSGEPPVGLQAEGADAGLPFAQRGAAPPGEGREASAAEDKRWANDDIIELSDDESFLEEVEEDEEADLVCVGTTEMTDGTLSSQVRRRSLLCKACSAPLAGDPAVVRRHAESHLTELGLCRLCGASFPERGAAMAHCLAHVGVRLFTCEMCQLEFCGQSKMLRHHYQTAASYCIPHGVLMNGGCGPEPELTCALCEQSFSKDFQTLRGHLLGHVCPQSLLCAVCQRPQLSLCSLLWHALTHLSLAVFTCPHCARCFLERAALDEHVATHAEEEKDEAELGAPRAVLDGMAKASCERAGEMKCFLCPRTFHSASTLQLHLSLHTSGALSDPGAVPNRAPGCLGKRKAEQPSESSLLVSSSPPDTGSLSKMTPPGFVVAKGFSLPEKLLQVHRLSPGLLSSADLGQDGSAGVRGKWYRCRYCGKQFAHSGEFTYHLRIHTGEKPYQCKVCLRFFRGRSTIICHLKTHAGALMYRCTVCFLYFSTLKLVSSHMELHKEHLPADFNIEQTFMYNDHSKEALPVGDS